MGIAFWPSHPSPVVTCGLVWPNMHLPGNQGAKVGTCFSGPQDPTYITFKLSTIVLIIDVVHDSDISKGLSPCKPGFEEKKSPFYGRPFNTDSRVMQLKDCRKQYDGSVWRLGKKCTMLPSTERDLGGSFGECFVYNEAWYREWYLRQGTRSWADILTHLTPDPLSFQLWGRTAKSENGGTRRGKRQQRQVVAIG
jgi:hypothetical protein